MFKIFDTPITMRTLKEFYTLPSRFPNMAYILINIQEAQEINGVTYPQTGDLYAISDREGLQELYRISKEASKNGISNILNNIPLDNEIGVYE